MSYLTLKDIPSLERVLPQGNLDWTVFEAVS